MTPDERADALAEIAAQLVGRVRDDEPAAFHRWVRNAMVGAGFSPPDDDALAMFTVLACAVPTDKTWLQLTQWRWQNDGIDNRLRPCGTVAAAMRHRRRGELLCEPCRKAERERVRQQYVPVHRTEPVVHRLSRGPSTVVLDNTDERDAA